MNVWDRSCSRGINRVARWVPARYAALLAAGAVVLTISPSLAFAEYTAGEMGASSRAATTAEQQAEASSTQSGTSVGDFAADSSHAQFESEDSNASSEQPFRSNWNRFIALSGAESGKLGTTEMDSSFVGAPLLNSQRASLTQAYVEGIPDQIYSGSKITPRPRVFVNGRELHYGIDYLLRYSANAEPGTATVGILGIGDYKDAKVAEFRIVGTGGLAEKHEYVISTGDDGKAVGIQEAGDDGLPTVLVRADRMPDQQWKLRVNDDGTVSFISSATGKALHVDGRKAQDGAKVVQWADTESPNQKWLLIPRDDESFTVVYVFDNRYALDCEGVTGDQGASMVLRKRNNKIDTQKFTFFDVTAMRAELDELAVEHADVIPDGKHVIVSAADGKSMLDTRTAYTTGRSGAQVRLTGSSTNLLWEVSYDKNGYAYITNMESDMVLTVDGNAPVVGANIIQAKPDGSLGQKWIIIPQDEKGYRIQSALWSDLVLDMVGSGSARNNEASVLIWTATDSKSQVWTFGWQTPELVKLELLGDFSEIAVEEWKSGMTTGVGYRSGKRYRSMFPAVGDSWNCSFTAWCMAKAGLTPGSTMPDAVKTAKGLYNYYLSHPWLGDIHPNDGTYAPQLGDIALNLNAESDLSPTAIVSEVGTDFYYTIEGDRDDKIDKVHHDASSPWTYFISINWTEVANRLQS